MSTQPSEVRPGRAPQGATPDMIESALASNREAIDHTLTELQERLSAEGLANMAMERLRSESGTEFLRGLRDTVVHNPMPVTVIALGIIWAAMSERTGQQAPRIRSNTGSSEPDEYASRAQERSGSRAKGSGRFRAATERTRAMMSRGRRSSSSEGESNSSGQGAVQRSRESAQRGWEFTREHPVLMAGAGIAVGAALASLLPTTRMERERVGPVRDEAVRSGFASEAGRDASGGEEPPTRTEVEGGPYTATQADAGDRGPAERRI